MSSEGRRPVAKRLFRIWSPVKGSVLAISIRGWRTASCPLAGNAAANADVTNAAMKSRLLIISLLSDPRHPNHPTLSFGSKSRGSKRKQTKSGFSSVFEAQNRQNPMDLRLRSVFTGLNTTLSFSCYFLAGASV
jgi:hypothetical protein